MAGDQVMLLVELPQKLDLPTRALMNNLDQSLSILVWAGPDGPPEGADEVKRSNPDMVQIVFTYFFNYSDILSYKLRCKN